jgi:NAD(P)H dehydrogenase (quinone)
MKMSFGRTKPKRKELRMRKILSLIVFCCISLIWLNVALAQGLPTILVVYHSQQGHTRTMAEAVARGARSVKSANVKLLTVSEATKEDVLSADAIIVGSPVVNANIAPEVMRFINSWPFEGAPLRDKIGAAFVTGGGISAGEELTQLNILHSMMIYGMIVVGGGDWTSAFGASAITNESPFNKSEGGGNLSEQFQLKGTALGKRVAELAVKWKRNK